MIVSLGMSCGRIDALGERAVEVMVPKGVSRSNRYLLVNRAYTSIRQLQDRSELAWPDDGFSSWGPDHTANVCLLVIVYLWAG